VLNCEIIYVYIVLNIRSFCVGFMVDRLVLGLVFIRILLFSPVPTMPPILRSNLHLNAALSRKTKRRNLGTSNKQWYFKYHGRTDIADPHFSVFRRLVWKQ